MTPVCCPHCRLRFTSAVGAYLVACPECGEPPQPSTLEGVFGFRIFSPEDDPHSLPEAIAVAMPPPDPRPAAGQ